jgi:hypothetical protein
VEKEKESATNLVIQIERGLRATRRRQEQAARNHTEAANQVTLLLYKPEASEAAHKLPMLKGWITNQNNNYTRPPSLINTTINGDLEWKVINVKICTGIANAGALVLYTKPQVSECGQYKLDSDTFIPTDIMSDKIPQYGGGFLKAADKIKQLPYNIRDKARYIHMVPRIENTLLSTTQMMLAKYVTVFDDQEVNVYNQDYDLQIKETQGAVLREPHMTI